MTVSLYDEGEKGTPKPKYGEIVVYEQRTSFPYKRISGWHVQIASCGDKGGGFGDWLVTLSNLFASFSSQGMLHIGKPY